MQESDSISEEIVIVGGCYGACADEIEPLFHQAEPVETKDIMNALGDDIAYLMPLSNDLDPLAVGVFNHNLKSLGFVWMPQAHAVREWMNDHRCGYLKVHIKKVNAAINALIAQSDCQMQLTEEVRVSRSLDMHWADDLPTVYSGVKDEDLDLTLMLIHDELVDATCWTDLLQTRIDHLVKTLPTDLSAHCSKKCMDVYRQLKHSTIAEARHQSDTLLLALVYQGSPDHMNWWTEHWFPDFVAMVAKSNILRLYESSQYTIERIDNILETAPGHLFNKYKANPLKFAFCLYYSALPQMAYDCLLTLIALRQLMQEKIGRSGRLEDIAVGEAEFVDLDFFDDGCFQSVEGQRMLRELLQRILSRINADLGRDWIGVYIAWHFFTGKVVLMKRFADFFSDIDALLPGALTKKAPTGQGYALYKPYIASLSLECAKWFIDNDCLPKMNEWRSKRYCYQVEDDRRGRVQDVVTEVYQGLMTIKKR